MISMDVIEQMIRVSKRVFDDKGFKQHYTVAIEGTMKKRIPITSYPDADYEFFLEIYHSAKYRLKVTLHFQNTDGPLPLLRIDYGGSHKNPELANDKVPDRFLQHCGQTYDLHTPHIHYYVQGYGLDWALPLSTDDFPVKSIATINDIIDAIYAIANVIKLETVLNVSIQEEAI